MLTTLARAIILARSRFRDSRGRFLYDPTDMRTAMKTLRSASMYRQAALIEAALAEPPPGLLSLVG